MPLLDQADAEIRDSFPKMRSFLVARGGSLIYEKYYNGHESGSLNDLRSATKSMTSILTGIAAGQGLLPELDQPLLPMLERYVRKQPHPELKDTLTLRRLRR